MMKDFDDRIEEVIADQVREVTEDHGFYNSPHEGFGIIREECIEASECWNGMMALFDQLDEEIRKDVPLDMQFNTVVSIREMLIGALMETIDTCVTVDRYIMSCANCEGEFARLDVDNEYAFIEKMKQIRDRYALGGNEPVAKVLEEYLNA